VAATKAPKQTASQKALWKQWNHEFRQPLGEAATLALAAKLKEHGGGAIPCRVESCVDQPGDVFDTYGRLVGDVAIPGTPDLNVNMWLAGEGWAFPTFYASMSPKEIEAYIKAAQQARGSKSGVWRWPSKTVRAGDFDWNLVYRGKGATPNPGADVGKVLLPKLFRRLSTWALNKKAKMFAGTFGAYLVKKPDELHLTADFLTDGPSAAPTHRLSEFVAPNGSFIVKPEGLVFREKPSRLVGPGGALVTW
jgi:endonuclease YncB( thermonuclease family)